ncbi:hypothetical protein ScalyP_jg2388 [Parmales sp. scaly parma]|nr:hypothetical protein ScalyP_jg2388 [Parmales sp. scaly parma]
MPCYCTCGCKSRVASKGMIAGGCTGLYKKHTNKQKRKLNEEIPQYRAKISTRANANMILVAHKIKGGPPMTEDDFTAALKEQGNDDAAIKAYKSITESNGKVSAQRNKQIVEQMEKCGEDLPDGSSRTEGNAVSLGLAQAGKLFNRLLLSNNFGDRNNHISHGMCGKHNTMFKPKVTINLETVIIDKTMLNREVWRGLCDETLVDPNTGRGLSKKMKEFVKEISVVGVSSGGDNVLSCNVAEGELGRLALESGFKVSCDSDMAANGMSKGGGT